VIIIILKERINIYNIAVPIQSANMQNCGGREKILAELKKMGAKRVFLATGTLCTDKTEREYELKHLKENTEFFKNHGFEVASWMWTFWIREKNNFVKMQGAGEKNIDLFACPLDENFRAFMYEYIKDIAKCGVDIINFDDDFRFGYIGGKHITCTCPLHMKKICDILGEELSPAELEEKVLSGGKNKYRDAWMKVNGDALRNHARLIRDAINDINPNIRASICACMPSWDMDGADSASLARIMAGDTKPLMRLIGAPYWAVEKSWGKSRLQNVIDLERMERSWCGDGIEIYAEGDSFPRPRTTCPSSYLELFDMAMRIDARLDGIMKYSIDYYSEAGYESGYIDAQIRNKHIYDDIDKYFVGKKTVGVRIYEALHKFENMQVPEHIKENENVYDTFFSPASRLLADNSIPSTYDGEGIGSIAFGENIRYVPREVFKNGIVIDVRAAMILGEMGIDTGFEKIGERVYSPREEFAEGIQINHAGSFISYRCTLKKGAEISSHLLLGIEKRSAKPQKNPFAFSYTNADGDKFFVLNFEAYFCSDAVLRGYARSKQIKDAIEVMSGKKLPAYSYGNPDLYIMCKEDESKKAVGLFNIFADGIYNGVVELDAEYNDISFINCKGELKDNKVLISEIAPFSFAGFEVTKAENQLAKNTVKATGQLKKEHFVTFLNEYKPDNLKVLFVGNSITLHGFRPEIGWIGRFGMAASCEENDYVHLCMREMSRKNASISFGISQMAEWECNYKNGEAMLPDYERARNFNADVIIMRLVENCPAKDFDKVAFKREYDKLIKYLNPSESAKIILTTGFYKHPADEVILEYAKENNLSVCSLGDLGESDDNKAIGLFEHSGVANHPGDTGMRKIADRILKLYDKEMAQ